MRRAVELLDAFAGMRLQVNNAAGQSLGGGVMEIYGNTAVLKATANIAAAERIQIPIGVEWGVVAPYADRTTALAALNNYVINCTGYFTPPDDLVYLSRTAIGGPRLNLSAAGVGDNLSLNYYAGFTVKGTSAMTLIYKSAQGAIGDIEIQAQIIAPDGTLIGNQTNSASGVTSLDATFTFPDIPAGRYYLGFFSSFDNLFPSLPYSSSFILSGGNLRSCKVTAVYDGGTVNC